MSDETIGRGRTAGELLAALADGKTLRSVEKMLRSVLGFAEINEPSGFSTWGRRYWLTEGVMYYVTSRPYACWARMSCGEVGELTLAIIDHPDRFEIVEEAGIGPRDESEVAVFEVEALKVKLEQAQHDALKIKERVGKLEDRFD